MDKRKDFKTNDKIEIKANNNESDIQTKERFGELVKKLKSTFQYEGPAHWEMTKFEPEDLNTLNISERDSQETMDIVKRMTPQRLFKEGGTQQLAAERLALKRYIDKYIRQDWPDTK